MAFFGTDTGATVADIVELVAYRFGLETCFHDLEQTVGAGQQRVA